MNFETWLQLAGSIGGSTALIKLLTWWSERAKSGDAEKLTKTAGEIANDAKRLDLLLPMMEKYDQRIEHLENKMQARADQRMREETKMRAYIALLHTDYRDARHYATQADGEIIRYKPTWPRHSFPPHDSIPDFTA